MELSSAIPSLLLAFAAVVPAIASNRLHLTVAAFPRSGTAADRCAVGGTGKRTITQVTRRSPCSSAAW